jgi:TRAP-type C4-dicarboxylate transport system permease small subunit
MRSLIGLFEKLPFGLGVVSGFGVLLIMLAVSLDVFSRSLFNRPIDGTTELAELLLVALIFLGLAAAQQQRLNYTVEIVVEMLPAGLRRACEIFGLLVSLGVVAVLFWYSAQQGLKSFAANELNYGSVPFPIWPARLIIAVGLGLLALQLVIDVFKTLSGYAPAPQDDKLPLQGE